MGQPVCLMFGTDVAVMKEYNLRQQKRERKKTPRQVQTSGHETEAPEGRGVEKKSGVTADCVRKSQITK